MSNFIREDLKKFVPYKPNNKVYKYKMDANESPFSLPKKVKDDFMNWIKDEENLNIYPETNSDELRCEIAKLYNLNKDNIVCGVGSDELIDCIIKTYLEINEYIIVSTPTFDMYEEFTLINRGKVEKLNLKEDFTIDTELIIKRAKEINAKLVFICSPNNPTGTLVSNEDIKKIANSLNSIIIVDEAYGEFSDESIISEIDNLKNVIVLKTFSKAYGIAGTRVGFAISNFDLINDINIVKPPFNLSTLSQKLALFCLKNKEEYLERIEYLKSERDRVISELEKNDKVKIYPSNANFIFGKSKLPICDIAYEKGIIIRKYSEIDGYYPFRITINTIEENNLLIEIIKNL